MTYETTREIIARLTKLIEENPELPIVASVSGEIVADEAPRMWLGSIVDCEIITIVPCDCGDYMTHITDVDEAIELYYDTHEDKYKNIDYDIAYDMVRKDIEPYIQKAISLVIFRPDDTLQWKNLKCIN